jgi:hypothetical protein
MRPERYEISIQRNAGDMSSGRMSPSARFFRRGHEDVITRGRTRGSLRHSFRSVTAGLAVAARRLWNPTVTRATAKAPTAAIIVIITLRSIR